MDREILLASRRTPPSPLIIPLSDLEPGVPFLPRRLLIGRAVYPQHAGRPRESP